MTSAIEGRNCELLRVELADGEGVNAEVGKLVYLRGAVESYCRAGVSPCVAAPA